MSPPTSRVVVGALVGALALAGVACSSSTQQADQPATTTSTSTRPSPTSTPRPADPAAATATASPTPTPTPTAATPTPTPDLLDELAVKLAALGIAEDAVECISKGLAAQDVDPEALAAAELDAVILVDRVARLCGVDLADYVDE